MHFPGHHVWTRTARPIPASGCHQRQHNAPDIGVRQFAAFYGSSGGHRIIHVAGIRCCRIPEHAGGTPALGFTLAA
ncbi:hypothetical protein AFE_0132 [Acidithiobacillus ferrooxidans ATCC 23270]|uniref:Uncharacterized protein n=1 Tax=Acidithiobacillus ferrooxidans (strain ATCC 23270 / DSM 14882 / CIP 104768 / NCIMB 8455) TaxID=243159 RepID=B7J3N0_ACIF2|nr:hypothetical protein AFE_0132 [Acidithiobacillus ferrooxidans ATCC 23270]